MSDSLPPFKLPVDSDAAELYLQYYYKGTDDAGNVIHPITRNLCLVSLSAVGQCGWSQASAGIANARAGIYDWSSPVCCWASVIVWAGIAGALTHMETAAFINALRNASGVGGEVGKAKEILWDGVGKKLGVSPWSKSARMPLGAMIFCGSETNQLYHVGIHVGQGLMVGACSPSVDDPVAKKKVNEMLNAGLNTFTTILPVDAMMEVEKWTFYTNDAFWKGW